MIQIEKGRHPVIEQTIRDGIFVSNDTYLNKEDQSLLLICLLYTSFIEHGSCDQLYRVHGLDAAAIAERIKKELEG